MKKTLALILAWMLAAALCACSQSTPPAPDTDGAEGAPSEQGTDTGTTDPADGGSEAASGDAKEFTSPVRMESDFVEFCLPEDHDGLFFSDMGANCAIMVDRYGNDVVAYHEYDAYGTIEKKTVGDNTFDYQKFRYMDLPDWTMYVIRICRNHEYYRFIYNVYASEYDDAQVEKFMGTIRFGA